MTEKEAEFIFTKSEDEIYSYVKQYEGFKYLSLIKKDDDEFILELSLNTILIDQKTSKKIKRDIRQIITELTIEKTDKPLNILNNDSTESFSFHDCKLNFLKQFRQKKSVQAGQEVSKIKSGTLGAILKLNSNGQYYLLSNYHVIMGDTGVFHEPLFDKNRNKIGEIFWGKFDQTHDVAIGLITNGEPKSGTSNYDFGQLKKAVFSEKCKTFTKKGPKNNGIIYSTKAIVNIDSNFFKDQILIKNLFLNYGDSGSVIVSEHKNDIIGICMGGDQELDIANKLDTLFKPKINSFTDKQGRKMPEILYKSFH